jgi:hypothetical protein
MSGPSPFVHAPFSYKRGDMRRYTHTHNLRLANSYFAAPPIVHLDPLLTPIKGRTRALLERVGRAGTRTRQALA